MAGSSRFFFFLKRLDWVGIIIYNVCLFHYVPVLNHLNLGVNLGNKLIYKF